MDAGGKRCCPGSALFLEAHGRPPNLYGPGAEFNAIAAGLSCLLGDAVLAAEGFMRGFDGRAPFGPCSVTVLDGYYRGPTDEEYADHLWAHATGRQVAEELLRNPAPAGA